MDAEENINLEEDVVEVKKKGKNSFKVKLYIIIAIILLSVFGYGYYWYTETNAIRQKAKDVATQAEMFVYIDNEISVEQDRCEKFISQSEGDFGSFEYCKKFIDWSTRVQLQ